MRITGGIAFLLVLLSCLGAYGAVAAPLVFVLPSSTVPSQADFTVALMLDTGGDDVLGLHVSIQFDNAIVQLNRIDPGAWFTFSGVGSYFYDYTHPGTDEIHFAGSRLGSATTTGGQVAVMHFTALMGGTSPLDFEICEVRNFLNESLGADHSTDDQIVIDEAIPSDPTTFGEVKALFR
ncbi:MAG: cohesin domain-containing protein [Candidatus Krumholzibacteriia bacterium]